MKRRAALAALITLPLTLAACSTSDSGGKGGDVVKDGSFSMAVDSDPGNLNPLVTNLVNAQIVGLLAYDSLIYDDPKTSKPSPYLATSWTESPTKVTYTLRDGITCSDGSPFTAQTAADNLNWIIDPKNESPRLESVVPADAKVTAKGNVLTVETTKPRPFMLADLGSQQMACEGALKNPKSVSAKSDGTGPFVIDRVVAGDSITLTRRDNYTWGPNGSTTATAGVPKTVVVKIVPSPSTRANLLRSGELNAGVVSGSDEDRLKGLTSVPSPTLSGMIIYNHLKGLPTAELDVRKALTEAIDLDTLTKVLTGGKGERATSLVSGAGRRCKYDTVSKTLPENDASAAAASLEAAGYAKVASGKYAKDGKALTITLLYDNSTDTRSAAAEYVAKQWEELGMDVKLVGGDENFVLGRSFAAKDPSGWTATLGLILQSGTPAIFPQYLAGPATPTGTNFASIANDAYEQAVADAADKTGTEACAAWAKAEETLFTSADLIPVSVTPFKLYFNGATSAVRPVDGAIPGTAIRVLK